MKVSRKSWHYRLQNWMFGYDSSFGRREPWDKCEHTKKVAIALVLAPMKAACFTLVSFTVWIIAALFGFFPKRFRPFELFLDYDPKDYFHPRSPIVAAGTAELYLWHFVGAICLWAYAGFELWRSVAIVLVFIVGQGIRHSDSWDSLKDYAESHLCERIEYVD